MASDALTDPSHGLDTAVEAVPGKAAILDTTGTVLSTNADWQAEVDASDHWLASSGPGTNVLERLAGIDIRAATRFESGLQDVTEGARTQFTHEFSCPTSDGRRGLIVRAAAFVTEDTEYVTVAYSETTPREDDRLLSEAWEIATATDQPFDGKVTSVLELGRAAIGTEYATLSRVDGDEYVFEVVAGPAAADLRGRTVPLEDLPNCERVVERGETLVLEDVGGDAPELVDPEWGIESYLGAPVTVDGDVYGTFCFYSTDPQGESFPEQGMWFVETVSDWVGHELEYSDREEKLQTLKENITDVVWMSSPDKAEMAFISDAYEDVWGRSTASLLEDPMSFVEAIHPDDRARVRDALQQQQTDPDEYEETYRVIQPDGEIRWIHDRSAGVYDDDGRLRDIVGIASDITERTEREQRLAQQRDELTHLQRLNALVRSITTALQGTATRDGIETAVCERLTESDLYRTVWIGTRSDSATGDPVIVPQTAAGRPVSYPEGLTDETFDPVRAALETGEIQTSGSLGMPDRDPEHGRDTTVSDDEDRHALAAVPLATGDTTFGVLVVYARPDETITEAERAVLDDLGQNIALAIQRVHSRRSLTAETAVELELRAIDPDVAFAQVTTALECTLDLERRVETSDGQTIYYIDVDGADPTAVCERLADGAVATECSVIRDADGTRSALIEARLAETARVPVDVLTDYGGSVTTAQAAAGDITLRAELPPGVSVRPVLEDLQELMPGITVVSKRHVDRPLDRVADIQRRVKDQLTPKQEAALKAAYAQRYHEWPRESTVKEIAETFDITPATLNYRLRKAHQTVVSVVLGS